MFLFSVHKKYMREVNKDLHRIHFRFVLKEIKNKKTTTRRLKFSRSKMFIPSLPAKKLCQTLLNTKSLKFGDTITSQ